MAESKEMSTLQKASVAAIGASLVGLIVSDAVVTHDILSGQFSPSYDTVPLVYAAATNIILGVGASFLPPKKRALAFGSLAAINALSIGFGGLYSTYS